MRRLVLLVLACSLLLALSVPVSEPARAASPQERRVALVIGNGAYKAAPLKNSVNDARDMAAALKGLGFDVSLLTDAGQQQMDAAVREFGLKLRQGGAGLFYYAGHGLQVGGENYLVPVGANIQSESDVKYACVPAGMVLGKMEDARNDLNIIILDACRNNPFARGFRSAEQGLARMDAPTGSLISYATAPGSVASDGEGRNGLFTQHLLRNMAVSGLPITEVFMRVRQSVVADTGRKQVPWEASSLIGQFYFAGQGAGAAPAAAVKASSAAPPAQLKLDPRAEKKRLAEEAARLRQEQQELAQLQALQAEKDRLEIQRQKLEQAKRLALAPHTKVPLPTAGSVAAAGDVRQALAGRYALAWRDEGPSGIVIDFAVRGGELVATTSGDTGTTRAVSITGLTLRNNRLTFRFTYKRGAFGLGGTTSDTYTCDVSGDLEIIPATYSTEGGGGKARLIRQGGPQTPISAAPQARGHAAQFAALARIGLPDARAYFEQAVQARPDDADARAGLAIAQVFSGREADAKYQLQRLNESGAQTPGVRLAKGLLLGLEGSADAAYQFNRAQEEGADRALVLLCQAAMLDRKGDMEQGQKVMENYATHVPGVEHGAYAKALAQSLNLVGNMAGRFKWVMPADYKGGYGSLDITFTRSGSGLAATATGKFWTFSGDIAVQDIQLKRKSLLFTLKIYKVLFGSFDEASTYRFTCDLSGSLDVIPVPVVEWEPGRDGRFVIRRDYANTRLERQL